MFSRNSKQFSDQVSMYHMYNFSENIALTLKKQLTFLIERVLKYSIEETLERSASGGDSI